MGIVSRHDAQLLPLVEVLESRGLTLNEPEALREAVADELVERGLADDDDPNAYGRLLEKVIDRLDHV